MRSSPLGDIQMMDPVVRMAVYMARLVAVHNTVEWVVDMAVVEGMST